MIGVIGSTRFIGKYIVRALSDAGESVIWFVMDAEAARSQVGDLVDIRECDLMSLPPDLPGLSCVVSASHIGFAEQVVTFCDRTGAGRAIFVSSSLVHSKHKTAKDLSARENEDVVRHSSLSWTILRPTMIYGVEDRNVSALREQILKHTVLPIVGTEEELVLQVYAGDVAMAVSAAVCRESARFGCFDIGGPVPTSYSQMIDQIAQFVGRNLAKVYIHPSIAYLMAWIPKRWVTHPRLTLDCVHRMREDRAFSIHEAATDLGYYPRSFTDGLSGDVL